MRLSGKTAPAAPFATITFDGTPLDALEGEAVAAALSAAAIVAFRRTRLGAPRGLWCGMGACFDCLVTIDGAANQRACMAKVRAGMRIQSQATPAVPLAPDAAGGAPEERRCDVLVVGAGPGGLSAALAAASSGASVVVLDERAQPGGQYFKPLAPSQRFVRESAADHQFRAGRSLEQRVRAAGATIESEATVWGAFAPGEVAAVVGGRSIVYRPRQLILATGAYERPVPIPGWTLPGVMTSGALQTLARAYRVSPGRRVLIAGNGPLNLQLAVELVGSGAELVAVVESAPRPGLAAWRDALALGRHRADLARQGFGYLATLRARGVPMLWGHAIVAAIGESRFERARLQRIGPDGDPIAGTERELVAEVLALGYGFVPSTELARSLGCRHRFVDRHVGYLATESDGDGRTSVPGVFAIGDGATIGGASIAVERGMLAGLAAAEALGRTVPPRDFMRRKLAHEDAFQAALWRVFRPAPFRPDALDDATVVCQCEEVTAGEIRRVVAGGYPHLGAVKRHTRCGMGRCQGRYCAAVAARIAGTVPLGELSLFAPRVPAKPVPLAAIAFERPEWAGHREVDAPPPLARIASVVQAAGPLSADVVVIGAGAVGSCCALYLAREGLDVLVLERDEVNLQASGANAGSLHVQLLSFDFGAKAQAGGHPAADTLPLGPESVRLWQSIERESGDDLEIRITGGLMVAENAAQLDFLRAKIAVERAHGIEAELLTAAELRPLAPALAGDLAGAELCPLEGKINPLRATYAVADLAQARGARFVKGAEVTAIARESTRWTIATTRGAVRCGRIVNAAGPWSPRIAAMVGCKLPVHGAPLQMVITEPAPPLVTQLVAHADRHLSLKQAATGGLIVGGGWSATADADTGFTRTLRASIEGNLWVARRVLPALDRLHVIRAWAAMNVNIDGAPIVGEAPGVPGLFNAVTSNGYTLAPIVGHLTAELVAHGRASLPVERYALARFG